MQTVSAPLLIAQHIAAAFVLLEVVKRLDLFMAVIGSPSVASERLS